MRTVSERFWLKVQKTDGCWLWTASKREWGYGQFWTGSRLERAHRFSYAMENGPIPAGLFVLHRCDTPACVRVSHLFLGTQQDNIDDMRAKGRAVSGRHSGIHNGRARLTASAIMEIRMRKAAGESSVAIAEAYGVGRGQVWRIAAGRHWQIEATS